MTPSGCCFGPSGHGKSFVALSWGMAIATGTKWLDHDVQKGRVVYVAGEGARGAQRRAAAWKKHHHIEEVPDLFFFSGAPQLRDDKEFQYFMEQITPLKPDLVIIDTLATFISGDENSSEIMGAFITRMKKIQTRLKGATVMTVHHTPFSASGKGNGKKRQPLRERGHTSLACRHRHLHQLRSEGRQGRSTRAVGTREPQTEGRPAIPRPVCFDPARDAEDSRPDDLEDADDFISGGAEHQR